MTVEQFWAQQWVSTCGVCGERIEGWPPLLGDAPGIYDTSGCRHVACASAGEADRPKRNADCGSVHEHATREAGDAQ